MKRQLGMDLERLLSGIDLDTRIHAVKRGIQAYLGHISDYFDCDRYTLLTCRQEPEASGESILQVELGVGFPEGVTPGKIVKGNGIAAHARRTNSYVVINNKSQLEQIQELKIETMYDEFFPSVVVPFASGNHVIGVVTLSKHLDEFFEEGQISDLKLVLDSSFSEVIAGYIEYSDHIAKVARDLAAARNSERVSPSDMESAEHAVLVAKKKQHSQTPLLITEQGILRDLDGIEALLCPRFFPEQKTGCIYTGEGVHPGAASGRFYTDLRKAEEGGDGVILYVGDLNELDAGSTFLLQRAVGIVFHHVSHRSHRTMDLQSNGTPMIRLQAPLEFVAKESGYRFNQDLISEGDTISIDGHTGEVFGTAIPVQKSIMEEDDVILTGPEAVQARQLTDTLASADELFKERALYFMINADRVDTVKEAEKQGVVDIGLVRSENLVKRSPQNMHTYCTFFLSHLLHKGNFIVPENVRKPRAEAFERMQEESFYEILSYQKDRVTQIRLLDPSLREYFSRNIINDIAAEFDILYHTALEEFVGTIGEKNRVERGAVLGINNPHIYQSQFRALFRACKRLYEEGVTPNLRIFIPYVTSREQVREISQMGDRINQEEFGDEALFDMGVTLERSKILYTAEDLLSKEGILFYNIGTNDLIPDIDGTERDSESEAYALDPNTGRYAIDPAISIAIESCVNSIAEAAAEAGVDNHSVGIAGNLNRIKLEGLALAILGPNIHYLSASIPHQIPWSKAVLYKVALEKRLI